MSFFDKIGKTITQGVDRAKFEAEKFTKTTRLQGELNDYQRQLNEKMVELGQRAYDLQRAGQINVPTIADLARAVDQLRTGLVGKEEELKAAQNEIFIEPLGGAVPSASAQQVPIETAPPPQPVGPKSCPNCSFTMPSTAMFCPNCGSRVP
jgi:Tfp pilus assembly protein FimV